MHSDHPTLFDNLNRQALIERKAEQIIKCTPPQCFGIHGGWGAGKTSFLQQLRYHLDGQHNHTKKQPKSNIKPNACDKEVITIWFDAWRYQHEASPVIALLHEIRRQFSTWAKFKGKAAKLGEVTVRSLLNSFSDITKQLGIETFGFKAKDIQKTGEEYEKQHLETRLGTDTVQHFLQQAIDTLLKALLPRGAKKPKLVIFIDDLDRCNSAAAYKLLEGLKVYLDINNCVFIIGMNQAAVIDAIAKERNDNNSTDNRLLAEAYLEKICSSIERLVPPQNSKALLLSWITQTHQNRLALALIFFDENERDKFLPPNPRKIKALANQINHWLPLLDPSSLDNDFKIQALIIIAYVYQFHSELFVRWQYSNDFFTHLQNWAKTGDSKNINYLENLILPYQAETDETTTTPTLELTSTFPEPDAVNIFWVQPLIIDEQLKVEDVTPIMQAISHTSSSHNTDAE